MKCPHCDQELKYRERSNRTCSQCHRTFAFEPKGHPLGLHDVRFRKTALKLGDAGAKYTAGQLRLALIRKACAKAGGKAPFYVMLCVTGAIVTACTTHLLGPARGLPLGLLLVVCGGLAIALSKPKRPFLSAEAFQTEILDRWRIVHGRLPTGLISSATGMESESADVAPLDLAAVVVCPEREVLACIAANGLPQELQLGLLSTTPPIGDREASLLDWLRARPELPVLLLHDASAAGAVLARDLPALLGLDPSHRIYDLGLHPRKSLQKGRFTLDVPLTPELRARLEKEELGADVAGTRPLRRARAQVSPEERDWLRAGNCSPILALTPASLAKRLRFAVQKLNSHRRPAGASVGFLTWPA